MHVPFARSLPRSQTGSLTVFFTRNLSTKPAKKPSTPNQDPALIAQARLQKSSTYLLDKKYPELEWRDLVNRHASWRDRSAISTKSKHEKNTGEYLPNKLSPEARTKKYWESVLMDGISYMATASKKPITAKTFAPLAADVFVKTLSVFRTLALSSDELPKLTTDVLRKEIQDSSRSLLIYANKGQAQCPIPIGKVLNVTQAAKPVAERFLGITADVGYVQYTYSIETEQEFDLPGNKLPVISDLRKSKKYLWVPVVEDSWYGLKGYGNVYWYETGSMQTAWRLKNFDRTAMAFSDIANRGTLGSSGVLNLTKTDVDNALTGSIGKPYVYKVKNFITFEFPLHDLSVPPRLHAF